MTPIINQGIRMRQDCSSSHNSRSYSNITYQLMGQQESNIYYWSQHWKYKKNLATFKAYLKHRHKSCFCCYRGCHPLHLTWWEPVRGESIHDVATLNLKMLLQYTNPVILSTNYNTKVVMKHSIKDYLNLMLFIGICNERCN
jgi:hypothetical protein